ncbi:helicase associated domain-containing protein [Arthrobacter sp. ZGTC412]|uniref:helicase associated domain-containing protein n=1 Tax=Arthrobacter sp. ZGTC412 TaxID=2058900 RepID=UPI0015E2DEB9|nr:helicase associated domain-containing protein [Arthrobacter sp. ZGTC412]
MKRIAPDPEFVMMYRKGIPTSKIAALEDVAETTVRYHLQIAARAEPGIRDEHKAALSPPARRPSEVGLRNLAAVIAFHKSEGRLPVTHGKTAKERALGAWLVHRRREAAQGSLSPIYREALAVIPGWDKPSTRKADDEARWQQRLGELQKIRVAGGDWPRHQKTDDIHERTLGVWLHGQRIDYRKGRLAPAKEKKLNEVLPGWREGRGHRGGRRASRGQKPSDPSSDLLRYRQQVLNKR